MAIMTMKAIRLPIRFQGALQCILFSTASGHLIEYMLLGRLQSQCCHFVPNLGNCLLFRRDLSISGLFFLYFRRDLLTDC